MQSKIFLAFLVLFAPVASATFYPKPSGPSSCKKTEFWWKDKNCCLPVGGPRQPPAPPKGSNCPPTNYYWNNDRGCCTPKNQPPANPPPPQCPSGWQWAPALWRCTPIPTPPTPPKPNPSPKPPGPGGKPPGPGGKDEDCDDDKDKGKGGKDKDKHEKDKGKDKHKRSRISRQTLCPSGFDACPVSGALDGDYECVDFATELEFCGGCPTLGRGQDCSSIEGAWNVGCEQGTCIVYTCAGGYELGADGKSCVQL